MQGGRHPTAIFHGRALTPVPVFRRVAEAWLRRGGPLIVVAALALSMVLEAGHTRVAAPSVAGTPQPRKDSAVVTDQDWHLLARGNFVHVLTQAALYRAADTTSCLMRVGISNTSTRRVGVDLGDYWNVIYPNQWSVSPEPRRRVIDEMELVPRQLTSQERRGLLERYWSGALVLIQSRTSADYFREFNGRCPGGSDLGR
ncbi:MAG: hypothetical protein ACREMX_12995, partial [Gemmatimonadales bacterium]